MPLQDQVLESALVKSLTLDANGGPCLVVFKNGAKTGMTIGKANNISSHTRNCFAGQYQESREWPVISTKKGAFSTRGDSGSCVADAFSRVCGIFIGGSGATESPNMTYVTPISFIMKVLHNTGPSEHAHLNPILAQGALEIRDEISEICFRVRRRSSTIRYACAHIFTGIYRSSLGRSQSPQNASCDLHCPNIYRDGSVQGHLASRHFVVSRSFDIAWNRGYLLVC